MGKVCFIVCMPPFAVTHASELQIQFVSKCSLLIIKVVEVTYKTLNQMVCFPNRIFLVVALLFYVHGKHLRSCRDGQLT